MNIKDLEILECEILEEKEIVQINETPHPSPLPQGARGKIKYNPAVKPLFKTCRERYEYLMEYGCTSNDDRAWLASYKESKEFKEYETDIC